MIFESLFKLDFVDILGNIKLFEVSPSVFSNFAVFHYVVNSSDKCKMYIVFALFGVTGVKWNAYPSICFFINNVHPNVVSLRILVYHDIKKW